MNLCRVAVATDNARLCLLVEFLYPAIGTKKRRDRVDALRRRGNLEESWKVVYWVGWKRCLCTKLRTEGKDSALARTSAVAVS